MTKAQLRKKYPPERLRQIRKLFDQDVDAWSKIQTEAKQDMRCISTEQGPWPDAEWNARHAKGQERPCLHEDVLTPYVNQVVNQIEMNPMGIEAQPSGNGADKDSAEFWENRIRQWEYEESASYARTNAAKTATECSIGFFKLETAYRGQDSQRVCCEAVMDPITIIPGFAKKPDWSDMRRCWELERMTHEEHFERYGASGENLTRYSSFEGLQAGAEKWIDDSTVQVAAWWHREDDEQFTLKQDGGEVRVYRSELEDEPDEKSVVKRTKTGRILKTLLNGVEVLDETAWIDPGDPESGIEPEIPIFVVTGRVKYENGNRVIESLVRKGRVGQLIYDYTISAIQEVIGMTPKAKMLGPEGTFDTSTNWAKLTRDPSSYAEYKPVVEPSTGAPLPAPEFITYEPPIQALEVAKDSILRGIQNAIGMAATERKDRSAKSGKALDQLKEEMQVGTSHYFGSLRIAQERSYRMLMRILPVVERDLPEVGTKDKFGKHEMTPTNPAHFDAKHSVAVGSGKLYQTLQEKQEDAFEKLLQIKDPNVELAVIPGSIRALGLGPEFEVIAKMLESIQPPQMQQAREGQGEIPPQVQQAIQQYKQQMQALNAHAKQLEQQVIELQDEKQAKVHELQTKERIAKDDNATKIAIAEINASVKEQMASLDQQLASIKHVADVLSQRAQLDHESDQSGLDRQHATGEAEAGRQHAAQQADADRQMNVEQSDADRQQDAMLAQQAAQQQEQPAQ